MRQLLLVFNVKAHSFWKSTLDLHPQSLIKNLSSVVIFGGFAVGIFFLARGATAYLIQQAHIGQFLFHRFLSMLLYVFFITVNLGNMIVCYATLYKSEEVNFLMGMPISHEKIFLIKFVDNFFYSSSTLTLLGLAMLLGYGSLYNLPWQFYFFTMFAVLFPFMLIAGILAVMVLMGLLKVASRIGIRWLLAMVIVVYLSAIYVYFKLTNPVQLVAEVMKHFPFVNEYFGYLDPPFVRFLPNHWVSEFLYWWIVGDQGRAIPYFMILILTTAGLMIVAGLLARKYYYPSWVAASDARLLRGTRGGKSWFRFMQFGNAPLFPTQTDAIVRRDFWMFFREPSQWLHLCLMILLLMIFLISTGSLQLTLTQPFLQVVSFLVVFLFNGFLIASVSLRFVFPSVSLESDTFWCVRSAPYSPNTLYLHKFLFSFLTVLIVSEVLAVVSNSIVRDDLLLVEVAAVATGFVALALTGLNLGAGAYFASFREKNPIRIASSQGATLTFLASMVYLSMVIMILAVPLNRYFELLIIRGQVTTGWVYLPLLLVGILSVAVFTASSGLGLRHIRRDF